MGTAPLFDIMPAMAAAGPCGEAASTGLDGDSGAVSRVVSGEGATEGDSELAIPVISI